MDSGIRLLNLSIFLSIFLLDSGWKISEISFFLLMVLNFNLNRDLNWNFIPQLLISQTSI